MKVVVTSRSFGSCGSEAFDILEAAGIEVDELSRQCPVFDHEVFLQHMKDADALIIGAHPITAEDMDRCGRLKIICKHGTGLDNIDLPAAEERGILVRNVPAANAGAVADLTFGLICSCARKIDLAAASVRAGEWKSFIGVNVYGKTLGLIGFGAVAKETAKRAMGFDMNVIAYDPYIDSLPDGGGRIVLADTLESLLQEADIISIHVPLSESTFHMIAAEQIRMMKDGVILINTARGGIVDEIALKEALESGKVSAAALDVLEKEKADDNPIISAPNVVITPHIGMYSRETINRISVVCARNVAELLGKKGSLDEWAFI